MLFRLNSTIFELFLATFILLTGPVWAQPATQAPAIQKLAISVVYFLDTTAKKSVEEVEQMQATDFAPFNPDKPISIKSGALWIRFSAANQTSQQGWRLTLPMATVDEAILYNRSAEGQWIKQLGGDTLPISSWAQPGRYPSFVLSDDRGRSVDYLLQVRHERGLYSTLPRVVNESAFITSRQNEHLVLGMYFGLAALVVVLALTRALVYRDTGFGSYAIYVAMLALTIATVSGISSLYLWPEWPVSTFMSPLLAGLTAIAADWFVRVVTRPKRFSRWLDRALLSMMVISPLGGLLTILQPSGWAYTVYSAIVLMNALVLLCVVVGALLQGDHDSRWVALGFLPIVLAIFVPLLRNFGLISAGTITELAIPVASAIEVVILFYGLHRRVSQPRSIATRVTRLLQIDPLTGVHTRQAMIRKLSSVLKLAQRSQQPYGLLSIHLSNAHEIEMKYGREAADRAMVLGASSIRDAINPGDMLARAGAAQFALLLDGPISESAATDVATKLLANALRSARDLPDEQKLKFQIAVGSPSMPMANSTTLAEPILARMVAEASAIGSASRKSIRLVSVP